MYLPPALINQHYPALSLVGGALACLKVEESAEPSTSHPERLFCQSLLEKVECHGVLMVFGRHITASLFLFSQFIEPLYKNIYIVRTEC